MEKFNCIRWFQNRPKFLYLQDGAPEGGTEQPDDGPEKEEPTFEEVHADNIAALEGADPLDLPMTLQKTLDDLDAGYAESVDGLVNDGQERLTEVLTALGVGGEEMAALVEEYNQVFTGTREVDGPLWFNSTETFSAIGEELAEANQAQIDEILGAKKELAMAELKDAYTPQIDEVEANITAAKGKITAHEALVASTKENIEAETAVLAGSNDELLAYAADAGFEGLPTDLTGEEDASEVASQLLVALDMSEDQMGEVIRAHYEATLTVGQQEDIEATPGGMQADIDRAVAGLVRRRDAVKKSLRTIDSATREIAATEVAISEEKAQIAGQTAEGKRIKEEYDAKVALVNTGAYMMEGASVPILVEAQIEAQEFTPQEKEIYEKYAAAADEAIEGIVKSVVKDRLDTRVAELQEEVTRLDQRIARRREGLESTLETRQGDFKKYATERGLTEEEHDSLFAMSMEDPKYTEMLEAAQLRALEADYGPVRWEGMGEEGQQAKVEGRMERYNAKRQALDDLATRHETDVVLAAYESTRVDAARAAKDAEEVRDRYNA